MCIEYKSESNPNIVKIRVSFSEQKNAGAFANLRSRFGAPAMIPLPNYEVDVWFEYPVLLEGRKYDRLHYLYDIHAHTCTPTFYGGKRKEVMYPKDEKAFERYLRIVSLPADMLTDEELEERIMYALPYRGIEPEPIMVDNPFDLVVGSEKKTSD